MIQDALLAAYRGVHRTGALDTALGRRIFEAAYRFYKRAWEPDVSVLRRFVRPGDWIVDVGANVGYFTLDFARWVSGGGKVLAIEPAPGNIEILRRSVAAAGLDGRIRIVEGVASDADGEARLALNVDNPADHKIGQEGIAVRAYALDGLVRAAGAPRIALVKVDVQGAEMLVLRGAAELLSRDRPAVMIEVDDGALSAFGSSAAQLIDHFRSMGYAPYDLRGAGFATPLSDAQVSEMRRRVGYVDILFLPLAPAGR